MPECVYYKNERHINTLTFTFTSAFTHLVSAVCLGLYRSPHAAREESAWGLRYCMAACVCLAPLSSCQATFAGIAKAACCYLWWSAYISDVTATSPGCYWPDRA